MDTKKPLAVVTGVLGQVGSYMLDLLLSEGYHVVGINRRAATDNRWRVKHHLANPNFELVEGDILDPWSIHKILSKIDQPFKVFHFACQSHVKTSFSEPSHTMDTILRGTLNILESIKSHRFLRSIRIYNSSSSEMFGSSVDNDGFQRESTRFCPQSPYACAKVAAHELCRLYRESYGMFVASGITFNMESPRRGTEFVTRKITKYVAELLHHKRTMRGAFSSFPKLSLGNVDSYRDWQFAGDAVHAMYKMLSADTPSDYVISTGHSIQVKDFLKHAFTPFGLDYRNYVDYDEELLRPAEVDYLRGDNSRIKELGWEPSLSIQDLARLMVENEPTIDLAGCQHTSTSRSVGGPGENPPQHPDAIARIKMLLGKEFV